MTVTSISFMYSTKDKQNCSKALSNQEIIFCIIKYISLIRLILLDAFSFIRQTGRVRHTQRIYIRQYTTHRIWCEKNKYKKILINKNIKLYKTF